MIQNDLQEWCQGHSPKSLVTSKWHVWAIWLLLQTDRKSYISFHLRWSHVTLKKNMSRSHSINGCNMIMTCFKHGYYYTSNWYQTQLIRFWWRDPDCRSGFWIRNMNFLKSDMAAEERLVVELVSGNSRVKSVLNGLEIQIPIYLNLL